MLGQEDVLLGLRHRTVCGGTNKNRAIHLGGTRDHVFHIISVSRAVDVGVVTLLGFVLNVGSVDGDTALALLWSTINVGVVLNLCLPFLGEHIGNRCSQGGFAVVNVADGADVDVGLVPFELLACHWN